MVDYGEQWKDARNALLHILSPKSVDSLSSIIEREAEKGVKYIVELAKSHGAIAPLYVDDEYFPFMRRIIKRARESDGNSLVKKVDSIKNEHRIDEIGVTVLMSKYNRSAIGLRYNFLFYF